MEILYDGLEEDLQVFLDEHLYVDVGLSFSLTEEQIAALNRTVEIREYEKPVVTLLGEGTTVVIQTIAERYVVLALPEPEAEGPDPETPAEEPTPGSEPSSDPAP